MLVENTSEASFWREPKSRDFHILWSPAFAGMTVRRDSAALKQYLLQSSGSLQGLLDGWV
jgi:hypothetical protein